VTGFVANATGISKAREYRAREELRNDGNLVIPWKIRKAEQLSEKRELHEIRHS
jgi:hypothetical protein